MGKTEAGQPPESSKEKKPAFQLSKAPIIHGRVDRADHSPSARQSPKSSTKQSLAPADIAPETAGRPTRPTVATSPANGAATSATQTHTGAPLAFEDLGPLPATYGSESLFLIARDPEWLFCYWDIDWAQRSGAAGSRVVLKMFHCGTGGETAPNKKGKAAAKKTKRQKEAEAKTLNGIEISSSTPLEAYSAEITHDARDWYIPVGQIATLCRTAKLGHGSNPASLAPQGRADTANTRSPSSDSLQTPSPQSGSFYAEIGYLSPDGSWDAIARSNATALPSHGISENVLDRFATIPFHLAFQTMLELVDDTIAEGEQLGNALSRIQTEGRHLVVALSKAPRWTPEQRHLLAALLGNELDRLLGMAPEEIDALLREQLKEHLSSATAALDSEEQAKASAFDTRSLDSSTLLRWDALEQLHSLTMTVDHAFWSSWLSSWKAGAGGQSSNMSSSALSGGLAASALSSWSSSMSSMSSMASSSWLSSWAGAGQSGGISSFLSSFLSSWPEAIGMKESAFWSSWLSSWSRGAGGQWGESSGGMSSFNLGSSWSAHPGSDSRMGQRAERDFYMHVNAEVIFYGGTHPDAQLWVDGKPVALQPDGSFRFHFKFPDGDASVPIVAQSPDGKEQRSVSLRLTRGTARRSGQGHVGDTPQPAHLSPLMGRLPHGAGS